MKKFTFLLLPVFYIITGCGDDKKPVVSTSAAVKVPAVMAPFRYHKLVEVSPGQYYDVLSWGRASRDTGSYLILHSDSSGKKYTTTTGAIDGAIVDVYNTDMDADGNPELLIESKSTDTTKYANIDAYEFNNNQARKLDFPSLKSSKKNYRGQDNFYIQEGKLIREFPSFAGDKPTGGKFKLEYGLNDNSFTINTLVKDSTLKEEVVQQAPQKKKESTKKKTNTKKKKRRRR